MRSSLLRSMLWVFCTCTSLLAMSGDEQKICAGKLSMKNSHIGTGDLLRAMGEEESIWRMVYSHQPFDGDRGTIYWHPPFPENAHWNSVYPRVKAMQWSPADLVKLKSFYDGKKCAGHVLDLEGQFPQHAVSTDEYFYMPAGEHPVSQVQPSESITIEDTVDFDLFSRLVQRGFDFPETMYPDFTRQMETIRGLTGSRYLLAKCGGDYCGAVSTFTTAGGYDFVMNLIVLQGSRGHGISKLLMAHLMRGTQRPILVHTNNPLLRTNVLPGLGYQSLGVLTVIPLAKITG